MNRVLFVALMLGVLVAPGARADHIESHLGPGEPRRDFPADFLPLLPLDKQANATLTKWADPHVGGWGSKDCPAGHEPHRPVVFVHGTTEDAEFWRAADSGDGTIVNVRQRFLSAGYCARELWAISYTGSKGYFTYNDINTDEVYQFTAAVRAYLGADEIDVVAHSLGVTVVRKAALNHPEMYDWMENFVGIAGANHGTTVCRGTAGYPSHACEELEPGNAWLANLNKVETPPGPRYLMISDGSDSADFYYLGPDALSPDLKGACNYYMPFVPHNTLARGEAAVAIFRTYLGGGNCPAS